MKLQLLLFLLIFIIPVSYAFSDFNVTTDQPEYLIEETIYMTGEVSELAEYLQPITILVINPDGNFVAIGQVIPNEDKTFDYNFYIPNHLKSGTYTVSAQYGVDKTETIFELLPNNIIIESNKPTYYTDETIIITGIMNIIDWSEKNKILYDVYNSDKIFKSGNGNVLNDDGTFEFTISTSGWNFDDTITVEVNIQDNPATTSFDYYNMANIENEKLHELITDNTIMINTNDLMITTHDTMLDQNHYTMELYNSTLIIQDLQILELQVDNQALQTELQSLRGIFTILNNTISDEFPIELNGVAINKVTNENRDLESEIIFLESQIDGDLERLDEAILGGNEIRIETLTTAIGSHKVLIFLAQNKLDIAQFNIDRYDLLPE